MDVAREVATNSIEMSAGAFAALTLGKMGERSPEVPLPFSVWKESLTGRIHELAAALRDDDPHLFADQVAWARVVCETRNVPVEHLRLSLECLREVLDEELDSAATPWVGDFLQQALRRLEDPTPPAASVIESDSTHGRLVARFLEAVLAGQRRDAIRMVVEATREGALTVRDTYLKVLLPAQEEIGRMWLMNEAGVADEHFVTATTKQTMAQVAAAGSPAQANGKTVVTAAVAGNAHDVAVVALGDFFELDGWNVIQLGADVPESELAQAVHDHGADLVALSVTLPAHRATAVRTIEVLRALDARPHILIGGGALGRGDSWSRHGADATALSIEDGIEKGRQLVGLAG